MTVLLGEGTVLTAKMLDSLADHDIFSVYIQAEDEEEEISAAKPSLFEVDEEQGEIPAEVSEKMPAKVAPKKERLQDDLPC